MTSKLLFLAGSAREGSVNKKLAKSAYEIAKKHGATATFIDLADFDMPIYNQDLEEKSGLPENAKKLKQLFIENDGLCLACPEYNGMITPLLKNALDWISRKEEHDESALMAYSNKTCLLLAASPGQLGGLRGLFGTRTMLASLGTHVLPQQFAMGGAYDKFDDLGHLDDDASIKTLENYTKAFIKVTDALK